MHAFFATQSARLHSRGGVGIGVAALARQRQRSDVNMSSSNRRESGIHELLIMGECDAVALTKTGKDGAIYK